MNNTARHKPEEGKLPAAVWWATTLAWTLTIYQFSTVDYGVSLTGWLLQGILSLLSIHVSPATFHWLHFGMRKLAHFSEYAIFALLLYGSFGMGKDFKWVRRRAVICAAIAAGYALTDELHQVFVPGRTASIKDSALDASGAIFGMIALYLFDHWTQTRARRKAASVAKPAET